MNHETEIQIIASLVAAGCAIPGMFLVLRGKAMITDSVSHSILPGIAAGFLITGDISSPLLIIGALVAALASALFSEALSRSRLMTNDSSIAFVYPFLFSAGVILVSGYAGNVHLDIDSVLLGEIAFAPFDRVVIGGRDMGPVSAYSSGAVALLNGLFITVFYKELKLSAFDPPGAKAAGFSHPALTASFSAVVCVTCVVSFGAVGSVLLIALVATPPCCALLLTNKLGKAVCVSVVTAIAASIAGFHAAVAWNTNIAGAVTTVLGAVFALIFIFAPQKGALSRMLETRRRKKELATALFLEYMADGAGMENVETICRAMAWDRKSVAAAVRGAEEKGYVKTDGRTVRLIPRERGATEGLLKFEV